MSTTQIDELDFELTNRRHISRLNTRPTNTASTIDSDTDVDVDSQYDSQVQEQEPPTPRTRKRQRHSSSQDEPRHRQSAHITDNRPGLIKFICDRRLHIFFAFLCLIVGAIMAVMLLSHLRNAGADQSRTLNLSVEQIAAQKEPVANAGGPFGAWLSQALFTDALGIGSLAIAAYLIILGISILRRRSIEFWSLTFKTLLVVITSSIVFGLLTYNTALTSSWGGTHGHAVNHFMLTTLGPIGPISLALILVIAVICVYLNDIIRLVNIWKKKRLQLSIARRQRHDIQEQQKVERQDTDSITEPDDKDNPSWTRTDNIDRTDCLDDDNNDNDDNISDNNTNQTDNADNGFNIDDDDKSPLPKSDDTSNTDKPADDQFVIQAPVTETGSLNGAIANQKPSDHRASLSRYSFPSLELLADRPVRNTVDMDEQQCNKDRIVKALMDKKITIASIKATVGPTVTLYEIVPTEDIRVAQIKRLEDDIAMSLAARGIRIIAPLPGKGTVGIEVPNNDPQTVSMRQVLASKKFREYNKPLPVALGATISNEIFVADLSSMPHVLVAGATGQGKSVGLNAIIASLLYKKHPSELKFVLIDPKEVEFSLYAKLEKHYLATLPEIDDDESPIITSHERVLATLNSLCILMDRRYRLLRKAGVRNIIEYNTKFAKHQLNPENGHEFMPYIVVIIDEFADLIMTAGKEIELPVQRITQKARAVGIHMVIATQRPSTNVLTGLIKANCPTRIAFRVMQMVDSRTILDRPGANQLIGKGDMLYSNGGEVERIQCAFISTEEVESICEFIGDQIGYETPYYLPEPLSGLDDNNGGKSHATAPGAERDTLFEEAARFIITQSTASTSSLQRRYQIGYNRAGKIMDQLEAAGIVSPASGSKPRNILVDGPTLELILEQCN